VAADAAPLPVVSFNLATTAVVVVNSTNADGSSVFAALVKNIAAQLGVPIEYITLTFTSNLVTSSGSSGGSDGGTRIGVTVIVPAAVNSGGTGGTDSGSSGGALAPATSAEVASFATSVQTQLYVNSRYFSIRWAPVALAATLYMWYVCFDSRARCDGSGAFLTHTPPNMSTCVSRIAEYAAYGRQLKASALATAKGLPASTKNAASDFFMDHVTNLQLMQEICAMLSVNSLTNVPGVAASFLPSTWPCYLKAACPIQLASASKDGPTMFANSVILTLLSAQAIGLAWLSLTWIGAFRFTPALRIVYAVMWLREQISTTSASLVKGTVAMASFVWHSRLVRLAGKAFRGLRRVACCGEGLHISTGAAETCKSDDNDGRRTPAFHMPTRLIVAGCITFLAIGFISSTIHNLFRNYEVVLRETTKAM
jgi:hypothetical protein